MSISLTIWRRSAVKLEQSFEVSAPLEQVWSALIDVERVAPCLPGAAVTGRNDDGSYNGTFSVKIGPTSASYSGRLEMREVDAEAHRATMYANGSDKRGQGGATANIVSSVEPIGAGRTRVDVDTDYRITGRLARFGRGGMIEDISEKLLRQFASCLQTTLAAEPAAAGPPAREPAATEAAVPEPEAAVPEPKAAVPEPEAAEPEPKAAEPEPEPAAAVPEPEPAVPEPEAAVREPGAAVPEPEPAIADDRPEPAMAEPAAAGGLTTGPEPETAPERVAPAPAASAAPPRPAPVAAAEPLQGGSLIAEVLLDRLRRNPKPAVAAVVVGFLLLLLRRRLRR
jgi:uncharacterized protein